jgi:hypothetical protein
LLAFVAGVFPASAAAHGPVAPVALDYRARVEHSPPGLEAKAVDGDQLMWMQVSGAQTVVVLDYQGAPYLRFSRTGVEVNHNSSMYYLNQKPYAATPPLNLGPKTPPDWQRVTSGRVYRWHDGRLHALATVALAPGASFVGRWRVPLLVNGRLTAITGGLWHAGAPSIVWFWPIAVLLLCVLAGWRVRNPALDRLMARVLGAAAVAAVAVAGLGLGLHGRPNVSVGQLILLSLTLAFVGWASIRVLFRRPSGFAYVLIAIAALYQGLDLVPTLENGFVLIALPAFLARAASVTALGTAPALILMVFRIDEQQADASAEQQDQDLTLETA